MIVYRIQNREHETGGKRTREILVVLILVLVVLVDELRTGSAATSINNSPSIAPSTHINTSNDSRYGLDMNNVRG
jgi:hypothetical protein